MGNWASYSDDPTLDGTEELILKTGAGTRRSLVSRVKTYIETLLTMTGALTLATDPTLAMHAATKQYVDAKVAGLSWKQAVRAATTAALTLASDFENGDTIDGVVLATGDRILIKNQAAPAENGIYTVNASGAPTRATDADSAAELVNASVYVSEGTTLADTQWTQATNAPITVNTTGLTFVKLTSGLGGDVVGPGSSVDNHVAVFDGATGKLLKDGGVALLANGANLTLAAAPAVNAVGFLGAPQIADQDDYTLALADSGGHYYHVSGTPHTLTIPANGSIAFPIGTVIGIVNENGAGAITLAITTDTLRWGSSTGSRTIAANGTASLLKVAAAVWRLTGDGIT